MNCAICERPIVATFPGGRCERCWDASPLKAATVGRVLVDIPDERLRAVSRPRRRLAVVFYDFESRSIIYAGSCPRCHGEGVVEVSIGGGGDIEQDVEVNCPECDGVGDVLIGDPALGFEWHHLGPLDAGVAFILREGRTKSNRGARRAGNMAADLVRAVRNRGNR